MAAMSAPGPLRHYIKIVGMCVPGVIAAIIHVKLFEIMHLASAQYPNDARVSGASLVRIFGDMGQLLLWSLGLQIFSLLALAILAIWVCRQRRNGD